MRPNPPSGAPAAGTVLGDSFRLGRLIAEGGMAAVYEAVHLRLGRRCAIKIMSPELASQADAIARFRREVEVTSQLAHPHVVQILDFGAAPSGALYLAMEYLEGEDLAQRLGRMGRVRPEHALRIVRQIASALAAAHARGIVHRDLKPANVFLLDVEGEPDFVKIVDFGISKVKRSPLRLTRASVLMGTPHYMAPEQAMGKVDGIDHRTDQWSLACLAWEMLLGDHPFDGRDLTELLYQIAHGQPRTPQRRVALTAPMAAVLHRALSKRQGDRFPTITAFARAFEGAFEGPVLEETASGGSRVILRRAIASVTGFWRPPRAPEVPEPDPAPGLMAAWRRPSPPAPVAETTAGISRRRGTGWIVLGLASAAAATAWWALSLSEKPWLEAWTPSWLKGDRTVHVERAESVGPAENIQPADIARPSDNLERATEVERPGNLERAKKLRRARAKAPPRANSP